DRDLERLAWLEVEVPGTIGDVPARGFLESQLPVDRHLEASGNAQGAIDDRWPPGIDGNGVRRGEGLSQVVLELLDFERTELVAWRPFFREHMPVKDVAVQVDGGDRASRAVELEEREVVHRLLAGNVIPFLAGVEHGPAAGGGQKEHAALGLTG